MRSAIVLLLALGCQLEAYGQVIVSDGQPEAVIVTAAKPTESAQRAASELQHFVELMSGAKLPIYAGTDAIPQEKREGPRLLVGCSEEVKKLGVNVPSGDDLQRTREGFVLQSVPRGIVIAGNEDAIYRGTEYAVYELLERLGCRWFFPGEFGQVVPKRKTIEIPELNEAQRPSFIERNIWMSGWVQPVGNHDQWMVRNKGTLRGAFAFPGDGSIQRLAPPEKYAKEHPEIYAMGRDGVRHSDEAGHHVMLCQTNPKTVEIAANTILEHFRNNPEANSYGFSTPDGSNGCRCERCVAANHLFKNDTAYQLFEEHRNSISDSYYNFVNNVVHEVTKEFPDRYIVVLAYAHHVLPPEGLDKPWSKNIIVQIARLSIGMTRPIGDPTDVLSQRHARTLRAWARMCPRMLIYDYDPGADLTLMPYWVVHAIRENIPLYKAHNVVGFTTEGQQSSLRTGLNYYVRAKLMWDVKADVDALLEDFYTKFFGPAAKPMKDFIEGIQTMMATTTDHVSWSSGFFDWSLIYPPDKTKALGQHLDKAEGLADTDTLKQRVRIYRVLHDYMLAYQEVFALERAGKYRQALEESEKLSKPVEVAQAIQPGLLPPYAEWTRNSGVKRLKEYIGALAARSDGELGRRLALAPREAQFHIDPHNEGFYEQWQIDEVAEKIKWDRILLVHDWTQQGYLDEQGRGYDGLAWYRFKVEVPALKESEVARLFTPWVRAERLWIWVNGHLVHSPASTPQKFKDDIDITRWLKPGEQNTFTYRMIGAHNPTQHRGLMDRPLVWAGK